MVTEPQRAARPRGTRLISILAAAAAVGLCLGGCGSKGSGGSAVAQQSSATSGSAATSNASTAGASAGAASSTGSGSVDAAIPAAAWIASSSIPLDAVYHWSTPSSAAKPVKAPELTAVQDCQSALSSDDKDELGAFPAAQAHLRPTTGATGGQDDWSAQETILATNDTSAGDIQGIYHLYTDLVADLTKCANTAPGAKVTDVSGQGAAYAATISIPTSTGTTLTWHEYLAAPYGYLVELSVWVAPYAGDKASAGWDGSSAAKVLAALQSGPCSVTKLC